MSICAFGDSKNHDLFYDLVRIMKNATAIDNIWNTPLSQSAHLCYIFLKIAIYRGCMCSVIDV